MSLSNDRIFEQMKNNCFSLMRRVSKAGNQWKEHMQKSVENFISPSMQTMVGKVKLFVVEIRQKSTTPFWLPDSSARTKRKIC